MLQHPLEEEAAPQLLRSVQVDLKAQPGRSEGSASEPAGVALPAQAAVCFFVCLLFLFFSFFFARMERRLSVSSKQGALTRISKLLVQPRGHLELNHQHDLVHEVVRMVQDGIPILREAVKDHAKDRLTAG